MDLSGSITGTNGPITTYATSSSAGGYNSFSNIIS